MKKMVFIILAITLANAVDISGKYIASKIMKNGKIEDAISMSITFKKDGTLLMMGRNAGTWEYKDKNRVIIHSIFDGKKGEIDRVIKCNDKELILESKPKNRVYYMRMK